MDKILTFEKKSLEMQHLLKEKIEQALELAVLLDYPDIEELLKKAEDEWWMNYDCGTPSEDITKDLLEQQLIRRK